MSNRNKKGTRREVIRGLVGEEREVLFTSNLVDFGIFWERREVFGCSEHLLQNC